MSPLLAQSGHQNRAAECPLSGAKRTSMAANPMSIEISALQIDH
jgi:hypothetical protein